MKLARVADEKLHKALDKLAQEPLPLKAAFKLKGIIKTVKEEFDKYEQVRLEALKKHGMKNEDATIRTDDRGNVQFDQEGLQSFAKELNELIAMEIDINPLSIDELGDIQITTQDLEALEGVIV